MSDFFSKLWSSSSKVDDKQETTPLMKGKKQKKEDEVNAKKQKEAVKEKEKRILDDAFATAQRLVRESKPEELVKHLKEWIPKMHVGDDRLLWCYYRLGVQLTISKD